MPIALEHLPADAFGLDELARAALTGGLDDLFPAGSPVARVARDVVPPADRFDTEARAELVERWEASLTELEPPVAALDRLRELRRPGAGVVLAEAVPAPFGGTLADAFGALHAVRLARELEGRTGTPVAPVVWLREDGEREDQAFLTESFELRRLPAPQGRPGEEEASIRAALRDLLWDGPHTARALERFFPRSGEGLRRAHARSLSDALGALGLVVLDPTWLGDVVPRALAELVGADPRADVERVRDRLERAGLPVEPSPLSRVLFRRRGPDSRAVGFGGDGLRLRGEAGSRTPAEAAAEILQEPGEWAAGAVLAPIVQSACLPLWARIVPWRELTAHLLGAELPAARDDAPVPFVPRLSATLVDGGCVQALERLGLDVRRGLALSPEAEPGEDATLAERLREVAEETARRIAELRPDLADVDPGLAVQWKRTAGRFRELVERVAARAERVERNRAGKARRHRRRIRGSLRPEGRPQQEVLGLLAACARHGEVWLGELAEEIDPVPLEPVVVRFPEAAGAG